MKEPHPWLLLLWGAPAAGKSTLAHHISRQFKERYDIDLCHLGTDRINHTMIGDTFVSELREPIYRGILELAEGLCRAGRPLMVEGTFLDPEWRRSLHRIAQESRVQFLNVLIECRLNLRRSRNDGRGEGALVPDSYLRVSHNRALALRVEADYVFDTELVKTRPLARFLLDALAGGKVRASS